MTPLLIGWAIVSPLGALAAALVMQRREGRLGAAQRLRAAIVFGLAAGTTTHAMALVRFGLTPDRTQPTAINAFWTALTLVDPAIAALVTLAPRTGLVATIALMMADVSVNVTASGGFDDWAIRIQCVYGLFVIAVAPYCWLRSRAATASAGL